MKLSRHALEIVVPLIIFSTLGALTIVVWHQQVDHQRTVLARHAEDVGIQASRRLEVFLESHITIARIFAVRWATHEDRDFSRQRFEEFAKVLLDLVPAFHSLTLVPAGEPTTWVIPAGHQHLDGAPDFDMTGLVRESGRSGSVMLSGPIRLHEGVVSIFAAVPLVRVDEPLGHLIVEFHTETLVNECFLERIRSEFSFEVSDGDSTFFSYITDDEPWFSVSAVRASREFPVVNRTWKLTVVPRREQARYASWEANMGVPLLGFLLSAGLSLLAYMLIRRMELLREARDRALQEIEGRRKAESALDESRSRYRSVFESATDGLIILGPGDVIVEANPAACSMHGYDPEELAGVPILDLVTDDHRHLLDEFKRRILESGDVKLDSVHVSRDGDRFDVELTGADFQFGGELRTLVIVRDVSERKLTEKRLALLSRKVLMAQEEERLRLSRDLHDELGQLLTAQRLELDWLEKRMVPSGGEAPESFRNATKLVEEAATELRRICRGLRPPLLDDLGLEPAVNLLVEEFRERTGIELDLQIQLPEGIDIRAEVALCTYRVLQESLTNVSRHSGATHVDISLVSTWAELILSVYDNGRGFDVGQVEDTGSGITGMRERANLVGGSVGIRSVPSHGTRVVFSAPIGEEKR